MAFHTMSFSSTVSLGNEPPSNPSLLLFWERNRQVALGKPKHTCGGQAPVPHSAARGYYKLIRVGSQDAMFPNGSPNIVVLKVGSLGQQPQHHMGPWKYEFSGPTPDLQHQKPGSRAHGASLHGHVSHSRNSYTTEIVYLSELLLLPPSPSQRTCR